MKEEPMRPNEVYTNRDTLYIKTKFVGTLLLLLQILNIFGGALYAYASVLPVDNVISSAASLDPVANKSDRLKSRGVSGVDQSSGAYTYGYTLNIPEGRNGISPKLNLAYNSQNTESSLVGYGWMFGLQYIERTGKAGTDNVYTVPNFVSSLHGELNSKDGISFEQKIDDGSFPKYTFNNTSWQMTDRDGNTYYFGETPSSRIQSEDAQKVGRWYMTQVRDKFGNGMTYTYSKNQGNVYPESILYTEHALSHPINLVTFNLENKSDQNTSYKYGFKVVDSKRISYIKVSTNGKDVIYFSFQYGTGSNGVRTLLKSVEEKRLGSNGDWTVLPKTSFEYEKSSTQFLGSVSGSISDPYSGQIVIRPVRK